MKDLVPPTLLRDLPDTESSLSEALELAKCEMPTEAELDRLASALEPLLSSKPQKRPQRRLLPLAAGATATLLAAAVAAVGIGATLRYFGAGTREQQPALASASSAVSTTSVVAPKGPEVLAPSETPSAAGAPQVSEKGLATDRRRDPTATAANAIAPVGSAEPIGSASFSESTPPTEIALLGRAERALSNDPATALELTEEHAARFPNGALNQEREIIAIQALLALGRHSDAVARGNQFRTSFPGSAHLRRLDLLLGN